MNKTKKEEEVVEKVTQADRESIWAELNSGIQYHEFSTIEDLIS